MESINFPFKLFVIFIIPKMVNASVEKIYKFLY